MKLLNYIILFATFLLFEAFIQTENTWVNVDINSSKTELEKLNTSFNATKTYSLTVRYSSYKSHEDQKPFEVSEGTVVRDGELFRSYLFNKLTIQNKKHRLVIDSVKKIAKISDPAFRDESEIDVKSFVAALSGCKSIKRMAKKNIVAYRFETKADEGILAQEIYFSDNRPSRIITFYKTILKKRMGSGDIEEIYYPRLQIELNHFETLKRVNGKLFDTEFFISVKGSSLTATKPYSYFKIIDTRYK